MKKIYVVLTYTGTWLSKLIKIVTRHEFTHVSISLDETLQAMFSFGRKKVNNPIVGGFVKERINQGIYKKFKDTESEIYEVEISDEGYEHIENIIQHMLKHKEKYNFNIIGLILAGLHKKIEFRYSFYCAEFVKYILENGKIDLSYLPNTIRPIDFQNLRSSKVIYKGKLKNYMLIKDNCIKFNVQDILELVNMHKLKTD